MGTAAPTRVRYAVLAFACALSLITYLDRVCISRVKKDMQQDVGLSKTDMGLVLGAFALGYALFEVPGGSLGDRWGARRVLAGIVLWWSLFTALSGCVPRFTWDSGLRLSVAGREIPLLVDGLVALLVVRFLFGAGEAGAFPVLTRVNAAWIPLRERALAHGGVWMSARLGGAFAPLVIGRLAAAFGWRTAFLLLGLLGIAWSAVFYWWFRDTPAQTPACNDAERRLILFNTPDAEQGDRGTGRQGDKETGRQKTEEAGAERLSSPVSLSPCLPVSLSSGSPVPEGHALPPLRPLLGSLTLWALYLASFGVSFGWYFYPTWQPDYLEDVFGINFADSEILTGLPFACGAVGCLFGGGLSDVLVRRTGSRRWGRSAVGIAGFTGAGLCVLATGFAAAPWQAVLLLCLAFLINDLAIPVIWAVCADVGGKYVGTVAGVMNMAGGVGAVLCPILIPVILEALPPELGPPRRWRIIFAGLAAFWFLAAAAWIFINASRPLFDER